MRTKPSVSKPLPSAAAKRVPLWIVLSLAALLGLLVYGVLRPKPPSAFDLPEAQTTIKQRSPWDTVR